MARLLSGSENNAGWYALHVSSCTCIADFAWVSFGFRVAMCIEHDE